MADSIASVSAKPVDGDAQSMGLAGIFALMFIIGALAVAAPLLFDAEEFSALFFVSLLLPIAMMVLFMLVGRHRYEQHGTVEIEQVADSLYFMGFMFTLVALLVALMQIEEPINLADITSRFGIAMLTTLVGLLLKVLLTQFRQQGGVTQRQAQNNLLRATRRFERVLSRSSAGVEKSVIDAAAKALQITEKTTNELSDLAKASLEDISRSSLAQLDTASTHATAAMDSIVGQGKHSIMDLTEYSKQNQTRQSKWIQELDTELTETSVSNSKQLLGHATEIDRQISMLGGAFEQMQESMKVFATTLERSAQKHQSVFGSLERFSANLADNNDRLSSFHGTLSSVAHTGNALHDDVERLQLAVARLESSLESSARVAAFMNLDDDRADVFNSAESKEISQDKVSQERRDPAAS